MTSPPMLQTVRLVKRFGGITALAGVDFELRRGEVHALCGENGAGKSTLIKILAGVYPYGSYEGEVRIDGRVARLQTVRDAEAAGIAVIHQELALVEGMTVAENVFLGHEPTRLGLVDHDRMYAETQALLDRLGLDIPANSLVADLGIGQKQLVEIAKALRRRSRALILDEPSAALTDNEVRALLAIVRDLKSQGIACVYISHKLDEVFALADRITVLRDGQSVACLDAGATGRDEVIRHMVGREINEMYPKRSPQLGEVVLRVASLCVSPAPSAAPRLHAIDFDLRAGEVLGIGGLMGAGRSELLMHLFGAWGHRVEGSVLLRGEPTPSTPAGCIRAGLILVSEDRKRLGLVLEQSLAFNLSLSALHDFSRFGLLDHGRETIADEQMARSLRIRAPHLECEVRTLSGGNQQKVVLGKALMTEPDVLLLDEPTRGIDVGAKQEIYELIGRLTARGMAIVLVSSELPELMGMSDRILMLSAGRVGGLFESRTATQEALLAAAMPRSPVAPPPPLTPDSSFLDPER